MQRNKKSQPIESNTRTLKSKYLQSKNPTNTKSIQRTVSHSNKIMLIDLCPQEKAKIGQLIKSLQQRKKENQQLNQQLNSWKSNYLSLDKLKSELENIIQTKKQQIQNCNHQIQQLTQQKIQKDIQLQQMHIQMQKLCKKNINQKINYGINTQQIEKNHIQTQTKQKKKKHKSQSIQVNTIQSIGGFQQRQTRKNNFYQPNSKSFDKIMKGERLLQSSDRKNYQTAQFRDQSQERYKQNIQQKNNRKQSLSAHNNKSNNQKQTEKQKQQQKQKCKQKQKLKVVRKQLKAEQLLDYKNWSQYEEQTQQIEKLKSHARKQSNQQNIQVYDTENDDDQFQQLARKWLELKQKNIQQLTQGYFFDKKNQVSHYKPQSNDKTLGIQSKLHKNGQSYTRRQDQNEEVQKLSDGIDEQQLNKALKSRDFSASRLLNSKSKRKISQNSDKKSMESSHGTYRANRQLNQRKNDKIQRNKPSLMIPTSKNPGKTLTKNNYMQNNKGSNFYNQDLLDLVQQMNK